jgi:hypothetical protein
LFQKIASIIPSGSLNASSPLDYKSSINNPQSPHSFLLSFSKNEYPPLGSRLPPPINNHQSTIDNSQSSIANSSIRSAQNAQKVTFIPPANPPLSRWVPEGFGEEPVLPAPLTPQLQVGLGAEYSFLPSFPRNDYPFPQSTIDNPQSPIPSFVPPSFFSNNEYPRSNYEFRITIT